MTSIDIESLYTEHREAIARYVRRCAGWLSDAGIEDMVSLVFEKAIRGADQWQDTGHSPTAWLYRIAHNAIVDEARKRKAPTVDLDHAQEVSAPTDEIKAVVDQIEIDRALAEISPTQRSVITERFLNDQSTEATAATVGRSEDAVKKLQQRGLAAMRRAWGKPSRAQQQRREDIVVATPTDTRIPTLLTDLQEQERQIKKEMRALQDRLIEVSGGIKVLRQLSIPIAPATPTEIVTVDRPLRTPNQNPPTDIAGARWSRKHEACVECGRTEIKHLALGYCRSCYPKRTQSA